MERGWEGREAGKWENAQPVRKDLETNHHSSKFLVGEKTKGSERGLIF